MALNCLSDPFSIRQGLPLPLSQWASGLVRHILHISLSPAHFLLRDSNFPQHSAPSLVQDSAVPLGGDKRVSTQWDESACQPLKNRGTGSIGPGSLTRVDVDTSVSMREEAWGRQVDRTAQVSTSANTSPFANQMSRGGRGWVSGTGPGSVERHVKQLHVMDIGWGIFYIL
jgi:hypothetical protein